jgi:hypothetical protein
MSMSNRKKEWLLRSLSTRRHGSLDAAILKARISAVTLRQENRNVVARYCGQGQLWAPVIHNLVVLRTHKLFAYRSPLLHYAWRARVEKPTRNHRGTSKWCHRAKVAHQRKRLTRLACLLVFIFIRTNYFEQVIRVSVPSQDIRRRRFRRDKIHLARLARYI